MLQGGPGKETEIISHLTTIKNDGQSMCNIAQLLRRAQEGPKGVTVVKLAEQVRKVAKSLDTTVPNLQILESKELQIKTDPSMLTEILRCLLENAVKASILAAKGKDRRKPKVTITISSTGDGLATLDVTDSGKGVPDDIADDLCRKPVGSHWGGIGIGLFIIARLVDSLGGEVILHNRPTGATFQLRLPLEIELS